MGRMPALPQGTAATAPMAFSPPRWATAWPGKNFTRCSATPIGPMPGPPPPCGMQKVLCRFKWQTSAPMSPGRQRPTCAFRFAPSMYTWPLVVDDPADAADLGLEHAVRRRVGDHQRRERVLVLRGLRFQVGEIDVAAVVA